MEADDEPNPKNEENSDFVEMRKPPCIGYLSVKFFTAFSTNAAPFGIAPSPSRKNGFLYPLTSTSGASSSNMESGMLSNVTNMRCPTEVTIHGRLYMTACSPKSMSFPGADTVIFFMVPL